MKHLHQFRFYYLGALVMAVAFFLTLLPSFRGNAQRADAPKNIKPVQEDSPRRKSAAPGHPHKTYQDVQADIDRAMRDLDREMKKLHEIELPRIHEELAKAMKDLDMNQVRLDALAGLQKADIDGIKREVELALKEVDGQKIKDQVEEALRSVDMEKIQRDIEKVQKVDMEKHMKQMREEMARMKTDIKVSMEDARVQMEKAKEQLRHTQEGLNELEKDGLIKKNEPVNIEWDVDTLILNGRRQDKAVSEKYKNYFGEGSFKFHNKRPTVVL